MNPAPLVPVMVAAPLAMAAILSGVGSFLPRRLIDSLAILSTFITTGCGCFVFVHVMQRPIVYWFGGWYPRNGVAFGISFYADPAAASLCVLTSVLTCMALLFSWHHFESAGSHYHTLMLVLNAAVCGFVLTSDLFNLFVFFELTTVAALGLASFRSQYPGPLQGAWNFGVTAAIAAVLFLTGVSLLYGHTGALNFAQAGMSIVNRPDPLVLVAFAFLACGVLVKDGIAPFHFWLADANAVAPTPACMLFSGVMVEVGSIVVLRLYCVLFSTAMHNREWVVQDLLLGYGAVTAVVGAIMCMLQTHLKRLLAYSTISHVGLVLLAGALLAPEAIASSVLYLIAHALVLAALFVCTGALQQRFGGIDEAHLHGKARGWYSLLVIYVLAALGLSAAPFFATARAVALLSAAVRHQGHGWVEGIFAFVAVVTAGAVLRSAGAVFFGWGPRRSISREELERWRDDDSKGRPVNGMMLAPAALLVAFSICLAFAPGLDRIALRAATDFHNGTTIRNRILEGAPTELQQADPPREKELVEESVAARYGLKQGCINVGIAVLVAFLALSRRRLGLARMRFLTWPADLLRNLHSGAVGDYAAWFTAGVAIFSGLLLLLFRSS